MGALIQSSQSGAQATAMGAQLACEVWGSGGAEPSATGLRGLQADGIRALFNHDTPSQ